jgi:hypothetical protein
MPVLVLVALQCVQVEDGVDVVPGAGLDRSVQVLEPLLLDHEGVHVVLEVSVVEGQPQQVQAQ